MNLTSGHISHLRSQQQLKFIPSVTIRATTPRVSVNNVSALQFESPEFAHSTQRSPERAEISKSRLELEVTEEIPLRENDKVHSTLEAFKTWVTMGDEKFRDGTCVLGQLVNSPLDKIKIDPSLV